ncbi:MAG: hypothetical protein OQJ97_18585 [Rhodospirillales bacterium]|nr:hypothetical protein [Rhodospirillales bacterium]
MSQASAPQFNNRTRLGLTHAALLKLEADLEKCRPAFERPGTSEYWLKVKREGRKLMVFYSTKERCLLDIGWKL